MQSLTATVASGPYIYVGKKSFDVILDPVLHIYIYLNTCISLSFTVLVHLVNGFVCAMTNPICFGN